MAYLIISDEDAKRLKEIAERENRTVEAVLKSLLDKYTVQSSASASTGSEVPADPLTAMDGMFDDPVTDLSVTIRDTMAERFGGVV